MLPVSAERPQTNASVGSPPRPRWNWTFPAAFASRWSLRGPASYTGVARCETKVGLRVECGQRHGRSGHLSNSAKPICGQAGPIVFGATARAFNARNATRVQARREVRLPAVGTATLGSRGSRDDAERRAYALWPARVHYSAAAFSAVGSHCSAAGSALWGEHRRPAVRRYPGHALRATSARIRPWPEL